MPSVDENRTAWNKDYDWRERGDEWSRAWGSVDAQWNASVLPRIRDRLASSRVILEIAPGYGRFSEYLRRYGQRLILVDLSAKCIDACRSRFRQYDHIQYHVNDGSSLDFLADGEVDFVFSFDSLVHADPATIEAYVRQLSNKLGDNGCGFIHHSNLGEYVAYYAWLNRIRRGRSLLAKFGLIDPLHKTWRDPGMSAELFRDYVEQSGMHCISQELVNWNSRRLIDCFSLFARQPPVGGAVCQVTRNPDFMNEARRARLQSGV